ncbi:MAG: FtsK/SpoIIIE domain-containing protein [Mycobacterium sp.]|nr:FtsK/SpoIIIE domain-containing protein [Mycobacterium sp.]
MATEAFNAPPMTFPPIDNQNVVVPEPELLEDPSPGPWFMRLIPMFMGVMMIGFVIMMVAAGMRMISPMMLMAPFGMLMGSLAYMGVGGAGGGSMGDLGNTRKTYLLQLRERRKLAHQHGRQIHALQSMMYPHPDTVLSRVGLRAGPGGRGATPSMWTVRPDSGPPLTPNAEEPESLRPWLTARIGVGITRVFPTVKGVDENRQAVDEQLEPFTAAAYRRFLRTQKFVTNSPLGFSFKELPAYAFRGDPAAVLALARAVIISLAYNSSPKELAIGLICDRPNAAEWDWLKWLPHLQSRARADRSGTARLVWRSVSEFAEDYVWGGSTHTVVFVDTPDSEVALPDGFSPTDTTFIVLRASGESLTETAGRLRITATRQLSTPTKKNFAHADAVSVMQARLIAQKMSRFRPPNWDGALETETITEAPKNFLEVLGVPAELDSYDPRTRWRHNASDSHFEVPIGFRSTDNYEPTREVVTLDFGEASVGGTGLHGAIQGITGTGKSFLLNGIVLSICVNFGPDKVNFILMDFKGGSTFFGYEKLPHVVASITNLDEEIELVERAYEVIEGEIYRRETFLRDHKAKDIVAYRKMRAANPDKYPALPELFIIVDEFREFMELHRERGYLKLLTRTGAVGRGLGMHIIPCSQFIDQSQLQDLMEHLTFGISLRAQTGQRSRAVLKDTEAAKDLPPGKGAAILRRDTGERLTGFISFNIEEPYLPSRSTAATRNASTEQTSALKLHRFALANTFTDDDSPASATNEVVVTHRPDQITMRDALLAHLSQFDDIKALELWKPSLRAPITYADIDIAPAKSSRLSFRLGDTDAPRQHCRLPYTIAPEGAKAHVRVVGRGHSGRTTAIEAIIGAAARAYPPAFCSFYLVDYAGAKLGEMEAMPNVGGYARKTDVDKVARLIGETFRLIDIREREFGTRKGITTLDQYFASRADNPVPDDPYGHFFLVIDGFPSYVDEDPTVKETFLRLLQDGGRLGVHLVISAESQARIPLKMAEFFGTTVQLAVEDPTQVTGLDQGRKALLRAIPGNQPGRCVDLERGLAARIAMPIFDTIEPIGEEKGNPVYDPHADHSAAIARFVTAMQQLHTSPTGEPLRAPRVEPAPPVIDYNTVWDVYDRYRHQLCERALGHAPTPQDFATWWAARRPHEKPLPIGVSTADLRIVTLDGVSSPHVLALGDPKTGRTSLLRGLINSIVQQFTPEQAQIVIVESKYALLAEQEELRKRGYLMSYAGEKTTVAAAVAAVKLEIERRNPTMNQQLTPAMIRDRSWYSGAEIFVLIDGVQSFVTPGYGAVNPIDPLSELIEGRNDLGLHVFATGPAQGFGATRMNMRFYKALAGASTPHLLFGGPVAEGVLWPGSGIKFAPRRPGQAALVNPETMVPEVIQTAHARPWDDNA